MHANINSVRRLFLVMHTRPPFLVMHTRVAPHSKRLGSADVENMASNIVQPFGGEDIASDIGLPSRDGSFTSRYRPQHRARSFDALKLANTWMAKSVLKRVHVLQAVANSLKLQPDQLTYEEKARALVEQLNVIMVAQYWLSQAFRTRKPYAVASASLWTVVACVLAIAEIVCLLSLGVAVNWPRCVTSDDCNTGQACARLYDYCLQNPSVLCPLKPTCVDCNHLAGAANGGSGEAWQNDFITGAAEHENATVFCAEALSAAEHAHFLPGAWDDRNHRPTHPNIWGSAEDETLVGAAPPSTPSFAHCLYARQAGVSMTPTDPMILYVVFVLVAMEVAAETREHANAYYIRRLLLPSKPLQRTAVSVCYTACRSIITLIGFLYSKAVRGLAWGLAATYCGFGIVWRPLPDAQLCVLTPDASSSIRGSMAGCRAGSVRMPLAAHQSGYRRDEHCAEWAHSHLRA